MENQSRYFPLFTSAEYHVASRNKIKRVSNLIALKVLILFIYLCDKIISDRRMGSMESEGRNLNILLKIWNLQLKNNWNLQKLLKNIILKSKIKI